MTLNMLEGIILSAGCYSFWVGVLTNYQLQRRHLICWKHIAMKEKHVCILNVNSLSGVRLVWQWLSVGDFLTLWRRVWSVNLKIKLPHDILGFAIQNLVLHNSGDSSLNISSRQTQSRWLSGNCVSISWVQ